MLHPWGKFKLGLDARWQSLFPKVPPNPFLDTHSDISSPVTSHVYAIIVTILGCIK